MTTKVRVYLQDEAPTIGCGWREVVIVEENASGVRIKDLRTGARKRIKMPIWQAILKSAKTAPVEVNQIMDAMEAAEKPVAVKRSSDNKTIATVPASFKPVKSAEPDALVAALADGTLRPRRAPEKKPAVAKTAKPVKVAKPAKPVKSKPAKVVRAKANGAKPSWELFYLEVKNAGKAGLPFEDACKLFPDKTENAVNCLPEAANARLAARGTAERVRRIKGANRAYVIA
jgi:hypothetical protein